MTTLRSTHRVVIVGAGLAGLRTAEELRRADFDGEIVLIGDEPHLPYDRPPLSKAGVRGENPDTTFQPLEFFAEQRIDLRVGLRAERVDAVGRTLALSDGSTLAFDELVVATGLRPRHLPGSESLAGVHVLRSLDDSRALAAAANPAGRALIVGAGFIGCEVAANLRSLGMDVVLVEPQAAPLAAVLGPEVGGRIGRLHVDKGVDVRAGVGVREVVQADGRVRSVELSDGTQLDVDLVVVGIGSAPAEAWLEGSGVRVDNGVVCDAQGRASAPHVWAVGDVAAWTGANGAPRRVEHWTNAGDQARVLAAALLGSDTTLSHQVPYFWSDQYELKIQALGDVDAADTVHITHEDGHKFLACYERDGRLSGVVGAGLPGRVMKMRAAIMAAVPMTEILAPSA
ncbi:NAD(P)/FAD-dependent oxidoreductase [Tomitella biformata]|uniref:NAD(P)/FAD-dependent oxidoreductase n=1 Tax=Tomitella biformata TaxID=630403 RepID=UPI0004651896|nr:FAD-dependent oxidoreductase [Tomitella biformata]